MYGDHLIKSYDPDHFGLNPGEGRTHPLCCSPVSHVALHRLSLLWSQCLAMIVLHFLTPTIGFEQNQLLGMVEP